MSFFDLVIQGEILHNLKQDWRLASVGRLADIAGIRNAQISVRNTKNSRAIQLPGRRGPGGYLEFKGYF